MADNTAMNAFIRGRGRGDGVIDRLADFDTTERQTALNEAMAEFERASHAGDEIARDMADARIERLMDEARAARTHPEPQTSFDGGVQSGGRLPAPARGIHAPRGRAKDPIELVRQHIANRTIGL